MWQRAMQLTAMTYRTTVHLPPEERYGLSSQLRRAAVSIPANIAEGRQRSSTKDFLRFLSFAAGSLAELETLVELSSRLYELNRNEVGTLVQEADEVGKMLRSLQQSLEAKLPSP
ncbi:MAG TPA: four helix bundle protein [Ramlibacter sp.]|nr:four helix bundle protein [Ramlibacter sp.]